MQRHELDFLVEALFPSVLAAGRSIMTVYSRNEAAEIKADGSPVTAADRNAENIILEALARLAPGVPVVAEERASAGEWPPTGDTFFLVDPLDGTREFVARRPEFTINIALIRERRPLFGLIYAPALNHLYWTASEMRAMEATVAPDSGMTNMAELTSRALKTRTSSATGLAVVASRSHGSEDLERWLGMVDATERMNIGSSLKFCLVANGSADLYPRFGPTREWDTAAGHAIVTAAGGIVTTIDGSAFLYGKSDANYLNPGFIVWSRPGMIADFRAGRLAPKA